jgi:DNA-binding response OmpR family regulator
MQTELTKKVEQFFETNFMVSVDGTVHGYDNHQRTILTKEHITKKTEEFCKSLMPSDINQDSIFFKNMELNTTFPNVKIDGKERRITMTEFRIISLLVTNRNMVVQRDKMINHVWPKIKVNPNNIDTHLSNLRRKLKGFKGQIKTIKNLGYIIKD